MKKTVSAIAFLLICTLFMCFVSVKEGRIPAARKEYIPLHERYVPSNPDWSSHK